VPNAANPAKTVVLTIVTCVALVLLLAFIAIRTGAMPANADAAPGKLETWAAKRSLHATLDREGRPLQSPLPVNDSVITQGVRLYGTYCATCHGTSDGKASAVARGLYQHAPQFAKDDVTDDPIGVTYWKITHGIRYTGMPSFDSTLTSDQRWAIATFLLRQDSLPPTAAAAWKALPSSVEEVKSDSSPAPVSPRPEPTKRPGSH
jgi:mono/diheme cytochrome c family protein